MTSPWRRAPTCSASCSSPRAPGARRAFSTSPTTGSAVAVSVGEPADGEADLSQLYEHEPGRVRGRDGVLLQHGRQVARVLDLPWGESDDGHLARAAAAEGRVVLAGGLDADNVAAAIAAVRPWAVDASSRLESAPGIKDHARVRAYVQAAR